MPEPYIPKQPHDLIRAEEWNTIQVLTRTDIETHDHAGGPKGTQIGTAGLTNEAVTNDKIADGTITKSKLDPNIQFGVRMLVPAGGDGQIGLLGETLEIAMRVRISDGNDPIANAHVEFQVLEAMFDGEPLDQYTAGSLHASSNVISIEKWPSGSRAKRVVVETNTDGIAQVQRVLGTHPGMSVQRVQAVLLDENEQRTGEKTLFTAHLGIATEIGWFPHSALSFLTPSPGNTVQSALDGVANALTQLGLGLTSITPFVIDSTDHRHPLEPGYTVAVADFAGVELRQVHHGQDLVFDAQAIAMALTVCLDRLPSGQAYGTLFRLRGSVSPSNGGRNLTWSMEDWVHEWLNASLEDQVPQRVIVEFMPSALNLPGPPLRWGCWLAP